MHLISTTVVLVAALATLTSAAPAPEASHAAVQVVNLADVHLGDDQAKAVEGAASGTADATIRDKRTIGPLRQLFPGLSQIVDRKIQQITRVVFRLVGRLVLNGGNNGGASGSASGASSGGGRKVSITLPTYPPTEDDEDEEDTETPVTTDASATTPSDDGNAIADSSAASSSAGGSSSAAAASASADSASASSASAASTSTDAENQLYGAESKVNEVRIPFKPAEKNEDTEEGEEEEEDLKPAASSDNTGDGSDQGEEDLEENETNGNEEEDNRNKRFLPFNVGASASGSTGAGAGAAAGSGGGSGNFLFDIIRLVQRTADSAARVTGKVYRLVAGTDDVGLGFRMPTTYSQQAEDTNSSASTIDYPARVLVAGSGTTQERDEAETAPADGSTSSASASASAGEAKDDGYSEGVPGPITRLFVIANRGIANLVQDLILRLAQTSERIVNFKARLITSII